MLLATWNVNSLRARLPRVLEFLETHRPDVLCLQETKTAPGDFPHDELTEAGYVAVDHSTGRWAGVAILAPAAEPPRDVVRGLPGEARPDEARWVEATVARTRVVSLYVPNGRALDSPAFDDKLSFLEAVATRAAALAGPPLAVAGDFNVAPSDADVYDPALFTGTTHTSDDERALLDAVLGTGLVDAYRRLDAVSPGFTWWDYRAGHFHKGLGMRIDLTLLSPELAARCRRCGIDRSFRKGPRPSDHAPLLTELG
ncbi:MAG: exodeoxyribonuclease III [Actinobacteria bacterium]|nr:exodeoxyribonuclease III [Actinomycetota bacterium]